MFQANRQLVSNISLPTFCSISEGKKKQTPEKVHNNLPAFEPCIHFSDFHLLLQQSSGIFSAYQRESVDGAEACKASVATP